MARTYTLARLFVDGPLDGDITLAAEQAHYLGRVLRLGAGDRVRVFNGRNGEVAAEIVEASRKAMRLTVRDRLRAQSVPDELTLLFAPLKRQRTATLVEKATELGATRLQPVITARTQFPKLNVARMRAQAIEAAEQTERLDVPEIGEALPLLEAVKATGCTVLMGDERGGARPLLEALKGRSLPLAVLVGPEGGWSEGERESLLAMEHCVPVTLGPRILRADTAAAAMLALVQAGCGDWAEGPEYRDPVD